MNNCCVTQFGEAPWTKFAVIRFPIWSVGFCIAEKLIKTSKIRSQAFTFTAVIIYQIIVITKFEKNNNKQFYKELL